MNITLNHILCRLTIGFTIVVTTFSILADARGDQLLFSLSESSDEVPEQSEVGYLVPQCGNGVADDRLWLIDTRSISSDIRCADLTSPNLSVFKLDCSGHASNSSIEEYFESIRGHRAVIYIHGNRMPGSQAVCYGLKIRRQSIRCRKTGPVHWVIWSWPSAKQGILVKDVRRKASRTEAQGMYLSWVLRMHAEAKVPTTLIGFSFGSRVITGGLHALAGGKLAGRQLPGPAVDDARFNAGLLAPAIERDWMARSGYHCKATTNLRKLVVLYNQRDAVLKRYWLLDRVRGALAMGYSGPHNFAPRADGSRILLRSRDCSPYVGIQHSEMDYYQKACRAGTEMAALIDEAATTN